MSKEIIVERGTKTVYREGSKIIKQFKAGYPKSAVVKEAFNHALAEESGLNVPALLEVKNTGEGWALVIEAVEGKTMAQLMAEQPENLEWSSLSKFRATSIATPASRWGGSRIS